jgi:hypothetical protein
VDVAVELAFPLLVAVAVWRVEVPAAVIEIGAAEQLEEIRRCLAHACRISVALDRNVERGADLIVCRVCTLQPPR